MTDGTPTWLARVPWWVYDVVATALIVSMLFLPFPDEYRATNPFTVTIALAPVIVLPLRRRFAVPVLAACVALYGVGTVSGTFSPGVMVACMIAMYGVANRSTRRVTLICAGAAFVAILLLSTPALIGPVFDPRVTYFAVWIVAAAAAGDATRSRRAYIVAVTERAERAEQTREAEAQRRVSDERLRIARDLHDTVAHQISVISLSAGAAAASLESDPAKAREALAGIRSAARAVLGEIGSLLTLLRAEEGATAPTAPQPGLERLDELVRQFEEAGLDVQVRTEADARAVTGMVGQVAYRVIQEGLTNVLKHGAEGRVQVLLERTAHQLRVVLTNPVLPLDGTHAAPHADAPHDGGARGFGLIGLRERVAALQGSVETGYVPGGFRLAATLPIGGESS